MSIAGEIKSKMVENVLDSSSFSYLNDGEEVTLEVKLTLVYKISTGKATYKVISKEFKGEEEQYECDCFHDINNAIQLYKRLKSTYGSMDRILKDASRSNHEQ